MGSIVTERPAHVSREKPHGNSVRPVIQRVLDEHALPYYESGWRAAFTVRVHWQYSEKEATYVPFIYAETEWFKSVPILLIAEKINEAFPGCKFQIFTTT